MSIAHWVLGIGDRHLENFVIDKRNAQLIGIDFNMVRIIFKNFVFKIQRFVIDLTDRLSIPTFILKVIDVNVIQLNSI